MSSDHDPGDVHDLETSIWVGKRGIESVVDELAEQLNHHDLVKVKFLRSVRTSQTTEELAVALADRAGADVVETRGHTAVFAG
ncbi:MAG: YhbY family RNA-binding protein [Halobacteriales archaeon]